MKYENHFNEAKKNINNSILDALEEIGKFGVAESQARTPVGKYPPNSGRSGGNLRRSQTYQTSEGNKRVDIGVTKEAPYGIFVHEGTSKQKAQPFLRDAIMQNVSEINNIIKKHLGKVGE
ncbi:MULTISPECIES: HK97-gp10 family putative phage morphogenesis protein [Clostridium]|uniref:HK97-gp10 family putative phage morphogenesis protein n=1 Tax=Clostridium TaxID=1485 RepID=UPI000DFD5929|nr:HK97-gp10 family putative phage morphogenesis protein [Clostridium sporogenes]MCW6085578.1 HK97 gp10 family phage protein [Clostridium sporogenes]STC76666.1 phage protein, HK97 gp10 family [Clostridium botulinum]